MADKPKPLQMYNNLAGQRAKFCTSRPMAAWPIFFWPQPLQPKTTLTNAVPLASYKTQQMEPDVRAFLVRIANSIAMVLLWMLVNMVAGIKYNLAFFEQAPKWYNYLYYVWLVGSLALLLWYLKNKWKNTDIEHIG
jgi:hypothetical protein